MMYPFVIVMLQASERVLEKAAHMAQVDPHGFILTIVSVAVVFSALFLLFVAYSIIGGIFTGNFKNVLSRCFPRRSADADQAAAVAIAIDRYLGEQGSDEEIAAIAVALHQYLDADAVHDTESGIITIKRQ